MYYNMKLLHFRMIKIRFLVQYCDMLPQVKPIVRRIESLKIKTTLIDSVRGELRRGTRMKTLHSFNELGWVAVWVAFCVFLFAIFIPIVNRALNL